MQIHLDHCWEVCALTNNPVKIRQRLALEEGHTQMYLLKKNRWKVCRY